MIPELDPVFHIDDTLAGTPVARVLFKASTKGQRQVEAAAALSDDIGNKRSKPADPRSPAKDHAGRKKADKKSKKDEDGDSKQ